MVLFSEIQLKLRMRIPRAAAPGRWCPRAEVAQGNFSCSIISEHRWRCSSEGEVRVRPLGYRAWLASSATRAASRTNRRPVAVWRRLLYSLSLSSANPTL